MRLGSTKSFVINRCLWDTGLEQCQNPGNKGVTGKILIPGKLAYYYSYVKELML
jgi:hypothetical protein